MPVQLLCRRTIGRCRPGRFLIPARIWPSDFSSLLDTEVEGRLTAYSEGPRSLQYLLSLHLPTGQTQNAAEILPDGWGALIMCTAAGKYRRGWLLPIITRQQTA